MRVAIVGSGCSGISALWALKSTKHEVHLFEAKSRLGGRVEAATFTSKSGKQSEVDTDFVVMNKTSCPNFINFLDFTGVATKKTPMSFSVSRNYGDFEWATHSWKAMFSQPWSFLNPRRYRLLFDVVRFNQFALDVLLHEDDLGGSDGLSAICQTKIDHATSIGEYLKRENYSQIFRDDYLIPLTMTICGTSPDKDPLRHPAASLVKFMWKHSLLGTLIRQFDGVTILGGASRYIDAALAHFPPASLHLNTNITAVVPEEGKVTLKTAEGDYTFDHVVLAIHGSQALDLLKNVATKQELDVLQGFRVDKHIAVLHSDLSLMPQTRINWSAWNFVTESPFPPSNSKCVSKMCLTYWINHHQPISGNEFEPVLVTLDPLHPPALDLTQAIWEYSQPLYDASAVRSQDLLQSIQNRRCISFCGSWTGTGCHEDGFTSGLIVARDHLGAVLPFKIVDPTHSTGRKPKRVMGDRLTRFAIWIVQLYVLLLRMVAVGLLKMLGSSLPRPKSV